MFETSLTLLAPRKPRMTVIEATVVTLGLHSLLAAAALASWAWHINFPAQPPLQVTSFIPTAAATLPPPPPAAPPKSQVAAATSTLPKDAFVAPTVIPDEIPVLPEQTAEVVAEDEAVVGGVEGGVSAGIKSGVVGGIFPGMESKGVPNGVVVIPLDARLPMRPLSQVYPSYPEYARIRGQEGSLVVRYIIDRKGRVREVKILRHAELSQFDESVVKAIRGWRFRPLVEKGETVEVMHDLTVYFRLEPL